MYWHRMEPTLTSAGASCPACHSTEQPAQSIPRWLDFDGNAVYQDTQIRIAPNYLRADTPS